MERKLATVLFVDLVDSTTLVARSDPEVVRRRVTEFFNRVSRCVTTHGGIVEKFAGDAVMAAFGIPQAHEDDAERAVRAAFALLDSVDELGLEARVGVESGEVVADDTDSTFATGEAVNLAARLQQAAAPGEILIGPGAHRLTLGKIETDDLGPLPLKGLGEAVWVWRALGTHDSGANRGGITAPLIGRDHELELLQNTYDRAVRGRRAHLFTIYGDPGVGKTRLARDFVDGLDRATVLVGRCLPYGEGVTYWPLAEMVKCAAGISDDDPLDVAIGKLRVSCEDEAVADLLGLASGVLEAVQGERSQQEIAWAAREWAERLAQDQPLVLAFEDIHWAEEPLLELIEHLAEWVRGAPLLLVCLARPELLDIRPGWGGGRLRATAIELEPLGRDESEELLDALRDDFELPAEARAELLDKTEGNPLFVEETIRMLVEDGPDGVAARIPDSLQALIAARIDRLPVAEKTLLQRAAVIGRTFWDGALAYLSPELEELEPLLDDLLLREFLLREVRSTISGEQAFRFKHVLIREVAYGGISKSSRAGHHARFAEWLRERAGEELLEIRAYHLDQAAALLAELDGAPPRELALEAAEALEIAGRRALAREANRSARKLLLRAVELAPTLERRYQSARAAWRLSDLPALSREMQQVAGEAEEAGDTRVQGRAYAALAEVALLRQADLQEARRLADRALDLLPEDDPARVDPLHLRATLGWWRGDLTEHEQFVREALEVARRSERKDQESSAVNELAANYRYRLEVDRADPLVTRALELADESGSIVARATALHSAGASHLVRGELDEAQKAFEDAYALFSEAGAAWTAGKALNSRAAVAYRKGDTATAERLLRESIRMLKPLEDRGTLCESQRALAQMLVRQGRIEEAERYALEARETVGAEDASSGATTLMALAEVRAAQDREPEAEELFRQALERLAGTDLHWVELEILSDFDYFLRARAREEGAPFVADRLAELAPFSPPGFAEPTGAARA